LGPVERAFVRTIVDEGRISGNFTQQEAQDLALVLRAGALPASITVLQERKVGPKQ
jgi:preprotein translocase subunit SecD